MRVDDVTTGELSSGFQFRYRGQLLGPDTAAIFDTLTAELKPHGLAPLFRKDPSGLHSVLLVPAAPTIKPLNPLVNIILFLLTIITTLMVGVQFPENVQPPDDGWVFLGLTFQYLYTGWPFAVSILSILLAHEFGHFFAARYHKCDASLPYFIPFPTLIGTMGAVIIQREMPKNKRAMFDIGVAGPLAGLVVTVPLLFWGLANSPVGPLVQSPNMVLEGNSLFYLFAKYLVFGQLLPAPADYAGVHPLIYWVGYFFTGAPFPTGGLDVSLNPVAWAAWGGLLVTALNLIPAGQLDGGHALYVLIGKRARYALPAIIVLLGALGLAWNGWWLWVGMLLLFGRSHPELRDEITELNTPRRILAVLMLVIFVLIFIPVPLMTFAP